MLHDLTWQLRCGAEPVCIEQHDPATSLANQARAVALWHSGSTAPFQDASFTKLREVSVGFALPDRWVTRSGMQAARVTISGRNLFTWTSYPGLDPEIVSDDPDGVTAIGGFFQPPLRTFAARLDVAW